MRYLIGLSYMVAAFCFLPLLTTLSLAFDGDWLTWRKLASTVLPGYALTTLALVAVVGLGTMVMGTVSGWLIATCRFPAKRVLEVLLVAPLAFPAYVLAYAYTDLLDHPGPVQSGLRALMNWGPHDYTFPEIRSFGGAAMMLIFVFYPYVYLLARSCFINQSPTTYYAARTLGHNALSSFIKISLPLAMPALASGVLLVMMETLADYGAVSYFGVNTLSAGLYRAWFSHGDQAAATQLALLLLASAISLVILGYYVNMNRRQQPCRQEPPPLHVLTGWRAFGACLLCFLPVLFGFFLPFIYLCIMTLNEGIPWLDTRYWAFVSNSLKLSSGSALLVVTMALILVLTRRLWPSSPIGIARNMAGFGYAVPGGVIAIGLLFPFSQLDHVVNQLAQDHFHSRLGLIFTGSIFVLVLAYGSRFMTAALNALESGYGQIKPSLDDAAKTLGATTGRLFFRIHAPMLPNALLAAFIIIFVEVMKELPITLMLRPFNFDTLAVQAYRLASDERLSEAAFPSLIIMIFGMIPVTFLIRRFYLRP